MAEKLLTIREVSQALSISEKEVITLAESGEIPAYKVGGMYLRFRPEQVESYRKKTLVQSKKDKESEEPSADDKLKDFFYFNDFYIFSIIIILVVLFFILRGYRV